MSNPSFGNTILVSVHNMVTQYQVEIGQAIGTSFRGLFRIFVLLYVVVVGYRVMMGMMGERTKDAAISIALVVVLHGLVAETGAFYAWVQDPIMSTALGLVSFFGGGTGGEGIMTRLDRAIGTVAGAVENVEPGGNIITSGMLYLKIGVGSLVLLLVTGGLYLVYVIQTALALVTIHILLIIAPPFIFFAAFTETRFIAWTWFKAVLNHVVWLALLALVMRMAIDTIEGVAQIIGTWDVVRDGVFTKDFALAIGFCLMMIYFLLKTSDLAASLTGGMGMQSNLAGAGLRTAGSALGAGVGIAAGAARPFVIGAAGATAGGALRAYSAMKGIIR